MKKINLTLSVIALAIFVIFSQTAHAQKVNYNSLNGKTILDEKTVQYTCSLESFASQTAATDLATKIKATKGVYSADISNFSSGNATMIIKVFKMENGITLQNALVAAGVKEIFIDGISVNSNAIVDFFQNKNKK